MGILSLIIKILLLVFNTALLAVGTGCVLLGVALIAKKNEGVRIINTLDSALSGANRKVEVEAAAGYGLLTLVVSVCLCAIGGSVLMLSSCGCYSAFSGKTMCLYCYSGLLVMFLGMQLGLVVGAKLLWPKITTQVQKQLLDMQNKHFVPLSSYMKKRSFTKETVAVSHLINTMQIKFECCGAKKVGDIAQSKSWKASNKTWDNQLQLRPITCCKLHNPKEKAKILKTGFDMSTLRDYLLDPECPFSETLKKTSVHRTTCPKQLMKYLSGYATSAMIFIGGIAAAETCVVVCACLLIWTDDDDDDDEDYDDYE